MASTPIQLIKVRNESIPAKVAGAIAHAVRERGFRPALDLEVLVMGERAIFVAVKALSRAQTYLAEERPDLYLAFSPRPEIVCLDDGERHPGYIFTLGWLAGK
jgi:stage V sporulation protein SpoVS